jgi:hypothetical protein
MTEISAESRELPAESAASPATHEREEQIAEKDTPECLDAKPGSAPPLPEREMRLLRGFYGSGN